MFLIIFLPAAPFSTSAHLLYTYHGGVGQGG